MGGTDVIASPAVFGRAQPGVIDQDLHRRNRRHSHRPALNVENAEVINLRRLDEELHWGTRTLGAQEVQQRIVDLLAALTTILNVLAGIELPVRIAQLARA